MDLTQGYCVVSNVQPLSYSSIPSSAHFRNTFDNDIKFVSDEFEVLTFEIIFLVTVHCKLDKE